MQPKFTRGPWKLIPPGEPTPSPMYTGTIAIVANSPSLYVVLDVGHPRMRVLPEEWEHNARLISAAPEMYAALRELIERRDRASAGKGERERDGSDGRYARARAALAKAEGRDAP